MRHLFTFGIFFCWTPFLWAQESLPVNNLQVSGYIEKTGAAGPLNIYNQTPSNGHIYLISDYGNVYFQTHCPGCGGTQTPLQVKRSGEVEISTTYPFGSAYLRLRTQGEHKESGMVLDDRQGNWGFIGWQSEGLRSYHIVLDPNSNERSLDKHGGGHSRAISKHAMVIERNTGNVGIGVKNPENALVVGDGTYDKNIELRSGGNSNIMLRHMGWDVHRIWAIGMRNSDGTLQIKKEHTTNPQLSSAAEPILSISQENRIGISGPNNTWPNRDLTPEEKQMNGEKYHAPLSINGSHNHIALKVGWDSDVNTDDAGAIFFERTNKVPHTTDSEAFINLFQQHGKADSLRFQAAGFRFFHSANHKERFSMMTSHANGKDSTFNIIRGSQQGESLIRFSTESEQDASYTGNSSEWMVGLRNWKPESLHFYRGSLGSAMHITPQGEVRIGESISSEFRLSVQGKIRARGVVTNSDTWYDFVLHKDYALRPLSEVEAFINQHQHLPDIPSEKEVLSQGVELGEMQGKLLMKIEELTLYAIQQQKQIEQLTQRLERLEDK